MSEELVSQVFGIMVFKHFKANYCKAFPEDTHSCESAWTLRSNLKVHIMKKRHATLYSLSENNKESKKAGQSNNYHIPQYNSHLQFDGAIPIKQLTVFRERIHFYHGWHQGKTRM